MKLLVTVLITLILAVSAALVAMENPGYVLIAVGPWTVETTLALTVVVVILAFATSYYVIRFITRMLGVPGGLRHWQIRRRERKAMLSLTRGLIDLAEGHWQNSEKQLLKYVKEGHAPLLNYLAAARAAQAQGADQRRDHYLKLAHESHAGADIAVGLTQAELQLQHHQLEQALATLRHLQQLAPKHAQVLKVLAALYQQLGDWERLLELTPMLRKRKVLSSEEVENLNRISYLALLNASAGHEIDKTVDAESLKKIWRRIPKHFQEDDKILLAYIERLVACGETNQLEPLIRSALKRHRNERLVHLYGLVESVDSARHLTMAESLLTGYEGDAAALLTVGRLSLRNKLWGKARSYLEASVNARPGVEAYNELGNLLDHLGEQDLAENCFREGLQLAPGCEHSVLIVMDDVLESTKESAMDNALEVTREDFQQEPERGELSVLEERGLDAPTDLQPKKVVS